MVGRSTVRGLVGAGLVLVTMVAGATASASPLDLPDDGTGKRWHALTDTAGLSPADVAQVCPRDGQMPCAGSVGGRDLTGWVWATADQVVAFMGLYDQAILTAQPPSVGGPEHLMNAIGLVGAMGETFMVDGYGFHHCSAAAGPHRPTRPASRSPVGRATAGTRSTARSSSGLSPTRPVRGTGSGCGGRPLTTSPRP